MKHAVTWWERPPTESAAEYRAVPRRILAVFHHWEMPASLQFHQFLVRMGEFGGDVVVEIDQPAEIQRLTTVFAAFKFRLKPVLDVGDAAATEAAAIA